MIKLIPRNLGKQKDRIKYYLKDTSESSKQEFEICKVYPKVKKKKKRKEKKEINVIYNHSDKINREMTRSVGNKRIIKCLKTS